MNDKDIQKLLKEKGMDSTFHSPQTEPCMACADRTAPCAIDRDALPATWWMHRATTLRVQLAQTKE